MKSYAHEMDWTKVIVLAAASVATSCGTSQSAKPAIDCETFFKALDDCTASADAAFKWDTCLPYSEAAITTGLYVIDFEYDAFFEGPYADTRDPWVMPSTRTRLHIDLPPQTSEDGEKQATIYSLTAKVRRPLCEPLSTERWLVVDEIISSEVVATKPSDLP